MCKIIVVFVLFQNSFLNYDFILQVHYYVKQKCFNLLFSLDFSFKNHSFSFTLHYYIRNMKVRNHENREICSDNCLNNIEVSCTI